MVVVKLWMQRKLAMDGDGLRMAAQTASVRLWSDRHHHAGEVPRYRSSNHSGTGCSLQAWLWWMGWHGVPQGGGGGQTTRRPGLALKPCLLLGLEHIVGGTAQVRSGQGRQVQVSQVR